GHQVHPRSAGQVPGVAGRMGVGKGDQPDPKLLHRSSSIGSSTTSPVPIELSTASATCTARAPSAPVTLAGCPLVMAAAKSTISAVYGLLPTSVGGRYPPLRGWLTCTRVPS